MSDRWFDELARVTDTNGIATERAPAKLKSRIYSTLVQEMATNGLLSLTAAKAEGRRLCVFEQAVALSPVPEEFTRRNPCRVCHARLLGEHMDHAPIYWPGCPYSEFHNG